MIDVMVSGDPVRLFVPHTAVPSATGRQGVVWFFHANGSNHTSLSTAFGYVADQLADDGLVSICPNFGGTTWTGPRALELLRAVVDWANGLWNITASLLRATSAGGALLTWAYGNRLIPAVIGGYTVNGVYDMEERARRLPDDTIDDYNGDWGLLAASNPARMPRSVWQGTRLRITGTPADTVVPFASHGRALYAAASPFAANASLFETPATGTGGHGVPSATNKDMLDTFRQWLVDAKDDTPAPPALPGAGTYENGSGQIALTGTWAVLTSSKDSGGSIAHSSSSGASVTLAFTGTGVSWISRTSPASGINEVVLDGIVVATVDRYSPASRYSQTVWTSPALARGEHTITIRRTGRKNRSSTGSNIVLDALVVVDSGTTPPGGEQVALP
ncbi:hypothetical protein [Microbacterium invictum]|uniref:Uncharacterized protein n=1 Tax=Microbacterium invictum TaxID=515415 RepID=A0ABZ0V857_9MICO|nr:hypothetical protein [Microbacterium invictum]WQB69805.1 hypothetical protein T9R20_14045 [Microbacterium invictum]